MYLVAFVVGKYGQKKEVVFQAEADHGGIKLCLSAEKVHGYCFAHGSLIYEYSRGETLLYGAYYSLDVPAVHDLWAGKPPPF